MLNILTLIFFSILVFGQEFTESQRQFIKAENILKNPGGENGRTDWTLTSGVLASESTILVSGKRSLKITLSAQALSLHQDSTLYQAQFADGVQGLASVRVKTSVAGLRVCSRQNGVINSNLCVSVQANGKWGLYKVPFTLGGTSNGISINSNGTSVTGDVYVDDAFVGAQELSLETNSCNSVKCETIFTAFIATNGVVSQENLDFINGNCTFGSTVTCNFNSGVFTLAPNINYMVSRTLASAGACGAVGNLESTTTSVTTSSFSSSFVCTGTGGNVAYTPEGGIWVTVYRQGADFTAAKQLSNGNTYSSTNADTDWQSCNYSSLAFNGLGNVTSGLICKRSGSDLLMKGRLTVGAPTASEARINLPLWNGVQLTTSGTQKIPLIEIVGFAHRNALTTTQYGILAEPSVGYLTIDAQSGGTAGLAKQNGSTLFGTGDIISFTARIPIEGWENSNIIIGQFNGLESCTDTYQCTDVFSASISETTGIVSRENVDFINGNCTVTTGTFTCPLKSGIGLTQLLNCEATVEGGGRLMAYRGATSSSSQIVFTQETLAGASVTDTRFNIICQKQGVDYIGKTAKAVASDQNIATPGVTKVKACYYAFGGASSTLTSPTECTSGTCAEIVDTCGTASPPIFAATGLYQSLTFTAGTFAGSSYVKCDCNAYDTTAGDVRSCLPYFRASAQSWASDSSGGYITSFQITNDSATPTNQNAYVQVKCEGQAP